MTTRTLVCLAALAALSTDGRATTAPAAPAAADPWGRIPPLPAGCYREDDYETKLYETRVAIERDEAAQQQINEGLSRRMGELGPELATKMQEFMMAHPQESMALLQAQQSAGDAVNGAFEETQARAKAMREELVAIHARYKADLERVNAPIEKKLKDLDARAERVVVGEGYAYSPRSAKEFNTISAEGDAAYEKLCAAYWTVTGAYPEWLKRFKGLLVEQIPRNEAAQDANFALMMRMLSTPEATYKPTASFNFARQYIQEADQIFRNRDWRRRPRMEGAAP